MPSRFPGLAAASAEVNTTWQSDDRVSQEVSSVSAAGGELDVISARNSSISASRFFRAVCAANRPVVTVLCAKLCQQPFIPHDTTSPETSREGVLQHGVKTHKPREQDREERKVLRKNNSRAHARSLKVAGISSV